MDVEVRSLTAGELELALDLRRRAFDVPGDGSEWVTSTDPDRTVGAFVDGDLVAVCRVLPFGQFFGDRSVPMGGLAGVAVAPEHRGRGHAARIVATALEQMRARGEVISTLWPATTRLYRGLGWEVAGVWSARRVPARTLQRLPAGSGDPVRRATRDDLPAIQACYGRVARQVDGFLDRPDSWWESQLGRVWDDRHVYVVERPDGELDGYVVYRHTRPAGQAWGFGIHVHEVVAHHPDAAVSLWRLVGSSGTQVRDVTFNGTPEDPLLLLLPEQDVTAVGEVRWMLRLVDAPGAIAARGFPPGLGIRVDLDVHDRFDSHNRGKFRLTVSDGHGKLEPGGAGSIRLGIGALASLFSGWASAHTLARTGLLSGGSPGELAELDAAFSGPTPWMLEIF